MLTNRNAMLRQVDEIYINTIREYGLYDSIWQAFAVFLPVRSVGVQARSCKGSTNIRCLSELHAAPYDDMAVTITCLEEDGS